MHLLNTLPQRLDPGATPTFAGLIAQSLTSPAATPLTLGTGTYGTALTVASATGAVTAATTLADQGGTIAAQRNGLAPAQGLAFDGTAGSTVANVPAFGTGDFTVSAKVRLDSLTASATAAIFGGSGNGFALTVFNSAGSYLIYPRIVYGSAITSVAAISLRLTANVTYTRSSATTGKIYVNGILADTVTDANNYTGVVAAIGSNSAAAEWFWNGVITAVAIENRALSAAEVLALYQSGAVASADYNTASNTAINAASLANGGVNAYTVFTGASATGFTASSVGAYNVATTGETYAVKVGQRFFVTYTYTPVSGGTPEISLGTNNVGSFSNTVVLSSGTNTATLTANANATCNVLFVTGVTSFAISNVSITRLGALLAPDSNNSGAGLEWLDVSGNRAHIVLPTSGVTWSLPSSQQIVIEASTATNGNQQLGGASLIDANKQWRIQSWTVNCSTGTPTISLGNVSAGTQYVSGAVMAAGNNDITLLARFPSTANLWANSSTTATLIHRITLVPAN